MLDGAPLKQSNKHVKTLAQQLRWQLLLVALALGLAIVISLSFITWRSVEFAADNMLIMEALSLEQQVRANMDFALPNNQYIQAYRSWEEIPEKLVAPFAATNLESNTVFEETMINEQGKLEYVSLLKHVAGDGETLYVLSVYDSKETDELIQSILAYMLGDALWLLVFVYIALFLLIYWLFKRTTEPMVLLSQWANKLKGDDDLGRVEFPISELNELAAQLKSGVDRITEYNMREQQFLKHASHEMRTPLATIQACLDTLDFQLTGPHSKTVKRALKASSNMRRLSQTLLWLARESDKSIEKVKLHLPNFVAEQVTEHQYLIQNRPVDIRQDVADEDLLIEEDLLKIIFANLLRNACQFTQEGVIEISMDRQSLLIRNPNEHAEHSPSDYQSFGLGLQLVSRICTKIGWQFDYLEKATTIEVTLHWSPAK